MRRYRVLDLFSGIAGFSLGFKRFMVDGLSPYDVVGYLEVDPNATATLIAAMQESGLSEEEARRRVINGDITKPETKTQLYRLCKEGSIDIIIGGPPCQSFSTIGPRSGDKAKQEKFRTDERDSLFMHYIEIVQHYKPEFFVFENVTGLLSKRNQDGKKYIQLITEAFGQLGYSLAFPGLDREYLVLNAADFGVPQQRHRVFVIGNRHGALNPLPIPTHCSPERPELGKLPWVTVRDAISDLPSVRPKVTPTPQTKMRSRKVTSERLAEVNELNKSRNPGVDVCEYHWCMVREHLRTADRKQRDFLQFVLPSKEAGAKLTGHIARGQQESDIRIFAGLGEGMSSKELLRSPAPEHRELLSLIKYRMDSFQDKYKKLAWDQPSGTIFAHMQKDGNRFIHPDSEQARTLTVREAARLQSFPDDYPLKAKGNLRYKYIGNAVPPLLGRAIAEALYISLTTN